MKDWFIDWFIREMNKPNELGQAVAELKCVFWAAVSDRLTPVLDWLARRLGD